jgi:hypothetical protein
LTTPPKSTRAIRAISSSPCLKRRLPVDNQEFTAFRCSDGKLVATPGRATFGRPFKFGRSLSLKAGALAQPANGRKSVKQPSSARGDRRADAVGKHTLQDGVLGSRKRGNGWKIDPNEGLCTERRIEQAQRGAARLAHASFTAGQGKGATPRQQQAGLRGRGQACVRSDPITQAGVRNRDRR